MHRPAKRQECGPRGRPCAAPLQYLREPGDMVRTHGSATCGAFRPAGSRPRCASGKAWAWIACLLLAGQATADDPAPDSPTPDRLPALVEDQPAADDQTPAGGEEPAETPAALEETATPTDPPTTETGEEAGEET